MIFPILKTHWTKSNTNTQKFEEKAILLKMWLVTETLYKNDELIVPGPQQERKPTWIFSRENSVKWNDEKRGMSLPDWTILRGLVRGWNRGCCGCEKGGKSPNTRKLKEEIELGVERPTLRTQTHPNMRYTGTNLPHDDPEITNL